MYKDKDKQREANRQAQARFKAKKVLPEQGITDRVLPDGTTDVSVVKTLHRLVKPERTAQGNIRVSKPGDADYETTLVNAKPNTGDKQLKDYYDKHRETTKPKRGKDIKGFIDLPMDVQRTITRLYPDVVKDHTERCRRSGIAIAYQHTFPRRYYE